MMRLGALQAWRSSPARSCPRRTGLAVLCLFSGVFGAAAVFFAAVGVAILAPEEAAHQGESHARAAVDLAEEQVSRTLRIGMLALDHLGDRLSSQAQPLGAISLNEALRNVLASAPSLCGALLLDEEGRVHASTRTGEQGQFVDLHGLGAMPSGERGVTGAFSAGWSTHECLSDARTVSFRSPPHALVLHHSFLNSARERMHLLALINPQALLQDGASHQGRPDFQYSLATSAGLIVASTGASMPAQSRISALPVVGHPASTRKADSYIGRGVQGSQQVVAFRSSEISPLVVVAEIPVRLAIGQKHDGLAKWLWAGVGWSFASLVLALVLSEPKNLASEG